MIIPMHYQNRNVMLKSQKFYDYKESISTYVEISFRLTFQQTVPTMYFSLVIFFFFHFAHCVYINPHCDYEQQLAMGQEYFIYNQEYPALYHPYTSCSWNARSPYGTVIVLSCNDMNISQSENCRNDKLAISLTGNQNFINSHSYCGRNAFTVFSQKNLLTVGLFSGGITPGGNFLCSLAAVRVAPRWCSCSKQPYSEETKIIGGKDSRVNEFPWMAELVNGVTSEAFCGASIISDKYALTAAHCLNGYQTSSKLALLVGDHNLNTGNDTAAAAAYVVAGFTKHPRYEDPDNGSDIAVVKTTERIKFNMAVGPVCLPFKYGLMNFTNHVVTVLGWGNKQLGGDKADILQKVNLTITSNSFCETSFGQRIISSQICTYGHEKDACTGDSGGPVIWKNRQFELIGVISTGRGCGLDNPAVNTRVTSFLPWIASVTKDTSYCIK